MLDLNKDQGVGLLILVGSVIGIVLYGLAIYFFTTIVLQITAFFAVAFVLGILAWIGYVMATTPPPPPLELEPPRTSPPASGGSGAPSGGEMAKPQESTPK